MQVDRKFIVFGVRKLTLPNSKEKKIPMTKLMGFCKSVKNKV